MIALLNHLLNFLFDLILRPFSSVSPWPGLIAASLFTAAVMVGLFSITSNPRAILRTRNQFVARTLELLLFQHDLRVSLTACGRILAANFAYLFQLLLPMAVGLIPLVLIFVQLESWFDRRPLRVGESTVLTVQVDPAYPVETTPAELTLSDAARIDSPPVRTPQTNQIAWRLVATQPAAGWAEVTLAGVTERKTLTVGTELARISPRRESSGLIAQVFAPVEPPLKNSGPFRRMELVYPSGELEIGLTEIHWLVAALVLMMAFSLILGQLFGVRIA